MENKIIPGKYMLKEIKEIKNSLISTIQSILNNISFLPKNIPQSFDKIHIVACGTSFNSGLIGKKLIEKYLNISCDVTIASEFNLAECVYSSKTLFILVSQSGKTTDLLQALNQIKKENLPTLAISNTLNSPLVQSCKYRLILNAGEELAVASTKAFNCQILSFICLVKFANSKNEKEFTRQLGKLKSDISELNFSTFNIDELQFLAHDISKSRNVYFIGKGFDHLFAIESALKLKETCYITTVAMPTQEVLHGTIASFDENCHVILIINSKNHLAHSLNVLEKIYQTGAKIAIITPLNKKLFKKFNTLINVPKVKAEVGLLTSIIPLQFLAYNSSIVLGNNPDCPRRLTKAVI